VFAPTFASSPAGQIVTTFGDVVGNGATTGDTYYTLSVGTNSQPSTNLSFQAELSANYSNSQVSYVVLPAPVVTNPDDYLFELGGVIPPHTVTTNGTSQDFNFLRAYCSIQNPAS
jgi:hypothetical protein